MNVSFKQTSVLVYALCKLHNYCIVCGKMDIQALLDKYIMFITTEGGIFLPRIDMNAKALW